MQVVQDTLGQVQSIIDGLIGNPVPADQPLMEAGLDSLGAVELRNALGQAFALELPATFVFDHPTAAAMAQFLDTHAHSVQAAAAVKVAPMLSVPADGRVSSTEVVSIACCYPGAARGAEPHLLCVSNFLFLSVSVNSHSSGCPFTWGMLRSSRVQFARGDVESCMHTIQFDTGESQCAMADCRPGCSLALHSHR